MGGTLNSSRDVDVRPGTLQARLRLAAATLVLTFLVLAFPQPVHGATEDASAQQLVAGVELYDGPVGVIVPAPGYGVHISAIGQLGSAELDVETDLAGNVTVSHLGPDTGVSLPASSTFAADRSLASPGTPPVNVEIDTAAPDECDDTQYNVASYKWFNTFEWYFRIGSTPAEIDQNIAAWEFYDAVHEVINSTNCGMADQVSAPEAYLGTIAQADDIYINSAMKVRCDDKPDSYSVVGFGNLPVKEEGGAQNYLGVACTWRKVQPGLNSAYHSDIRLNKEDFQWGAEPMPEGCGKYSVQGVATHEFGHTFGLQHVSEADHGKLTMSTKINAPCKEPEASFGKGDILGMRQRY